MRRSWRPNTYSANDHSLSIFQSWVERRIRRNHIGVEVLSKTLVGDFWDYMREERGNSINTANQRVRAVEQLWAWCWDHEEHGACVPRPRKVKLPSGENTAVHAPTWAEMDAMIDAHVAEHYARLCWVMRCTGLRRGQAMALRWDDLDIERGMLTIRGELGKSKKERLGRIIPVAPVLLDEVAGWGRREGHLVHWPPAAREVRTDVMRRAWQRAGVPDWKWRQRSAHAFRKGFISGLVELGANREAVEYLVGHSQGIRGTYTAAFAFRLEEAVKLVPPALLSVRTASQPGLFERAT